MASAGLAIPLLIVYAFLTILALLLLAPRPLCTPAVALARATQTKHGALVLLTLCTVIALLLASPIFEAVMLSTASEANHRDRAEQEARTTLAAVLIVTILLLIAVLRKLGTMLAEVDRKRLSEAALLKQVAGLRQEYDRLMSAQGPAGGGAKQGGGAGAEVALLEQRCQQLQEERDAATKAQQAAEANATALKSQAKGLENEYDRLLADFDTLQAQLARSGGGTGEWAMKKGS